MRKPILLLTTLLLAACAEPTGDATASGVLAPTANLLSYTVSDISTGPTDDSYAWGINTKRVVVGWSNIPGGGTHGWVASNPAAPAWLPEPRGAIGSEGLDITNSGLVSGTVIYGIGSSKPAFWPSKTSLPRIIPLPAGAPTGDGYGVNYLGQVAGTYTDAVGNRQAFFWEPTTNVTTTLGTFGGASSQANGINDFGQVVGCADDPLTGQPQAFVWTSGTGLNRLDPASPISCAHGINGRGDAAGWMEQSGVDSAALFPACCTARHFLPRRSIGAMLHDLNDNQTMVGTVSLSTGNFAFVADAGFLTTYLPLPGTSSESHAMAINGCGAIVGWAIDTKVRALLWRPPGC